MASGEQTSRQGTGRQGEKSSHALTVLNFNCHCEEHPFVGSGQALGEAKGCDEAISPIAQQGDCFAVLAMTKE